MSQLQVRHSTIHFASFKLNMREKDYWKKIKNPWTDIEGYHCFACSPNNSSGLHLEFFEDGEDIVCEWLPDIRYQGWLNTLHGGIQATLMDEVAGWVVTTKLGTCGVTSQMKIRFLKRIDTTEGHVIIRARLEEMKRNLAMISAEIRNSKNEICATSNLVYFTYSKEVAAKTFFLRTPKEND